MKKLYATNFDKTFYKNENDLEIKEIYFRLLLDVV